MLSGQHQQDPQHPQKANGQKGQDHGPDRITRSAACAGKAFRQSIKQEKWGHSPHKSNRLGYDCRRILHGNKQDAQRGRQEIQAKAYRPHCGHGHGRTDPIAFTDPVPTSRPHILGGIGRQCRSHGIRQEPDQHIQLVADAPGCNGVCSHRVHRCLHNGIGHREQHRLQCQRNAGPYHGPQVFQPPPEPPCADPLRQFFPCHPQCHCRTDHLGKNRCDRRTCGSHPQPAHQQNVSHNVDNRTDQQNIQGTFGISKGTQDTGGHVV